MHLSEKYKGRIKAFIIAFLITILISILLTFVLTSLYRMENATSAQGYIVFNIKKSEEKQVDIIALNRKINLNLNNTSKIVEYGKKLDVLIPAEIRAFFCAVKYGEEAVSDWVYNIPE